VFSQTRLAVAIAAAAMISGSGAAAEGPVFSFGALVTSDIIRSGDTLTGHRPGAVITTEAEVSGFFAGLELLTLRGGADSWQAEVSLGYRWAMEPAGFEFGIARVRADDSGWGDTEVFGSVEFALGERTTVGLGAAYAPRPREWTDVSLTVSHDLTDRFGLSATLGRYPAGGLDFGDVGVSYAVTDQVAFDLRYHRSRAIGSRVAASLVFALGGN